MGLSGRKSKQRIGHDPRNLSWADDAARFGSNYLAKFGWESSKGLGVSGEGRTTHIKVAQKLDMMGIGAAQDPNGVAWKQNRDYENLLKRLNEANGGEEEAQTGSGFVRPEGNASEGEGDEKKKEKRKKEKVKKKRKREENDVDTDEKLKKKNVEKHTCDTDIKFTAPAPPRAEPLHSAEQKASRVIPRHRSHRARHIAAKSIGLKSAAAISEILGIAPSSSCATPSGTQTKLTSVHDDDGDALDTDKITTSTKTLQDYFKGKMDVTSLLTGTLTGTSDSPRAGLGSRLQFSGHISSTFMTAPRGGKAATEKSIQGAVD